jgi:CBS domain-containing protein
MPSPGQVASGALNAAMLPVAVARQVLPAKKGLPLYLGLGVLGAADVLEWPVALGIGVGYAVLRRGDGVLAAPPAATTADARPTAESAGNKEEKSTMTTAREIMTPDVTCIGAKETALDAAKKMTELGVGALPICGTDERLKGMLTDRDIVVKVLGAGNDPAQVKAGDLAQGEVVTIGADDEAEEILRTMSRHKVRRLPVIDGHTLVGIVAQADVARALPDPKVGDLLEAIST